MKKSNKVKIEIWLEMTPLDGRQLTKEEEYNVKMQGLLGYMKKLEKEHKNGKQKESEDIPNQSNSPIQID